jgi:hypothetical protein
VRDERERDKWYVRERDTRTRNGESGGGGLLNKAKLKVYSELKYNKKIEILEKSSLKAAKLIKNRPKTNLSKPICLTSYCQNIYLCVIPNV